MTGRLRVRRETPYRFVCFGRRLRHPWYVTDKTETRVAPHWRTWAEAFGWALLHADDLDPIGEWSERRPYLAGVR